MVKNPLFSYFHPIKLFLGHEVVIGFVTGPLNMSLGVLFVLADWQVGMFGLSGIVDRPSDRLFVWNITLSR